LLTGWIILNWGTAVSESYGDPSIDVCAETAVYFTMIEVEMNFQNWNLFDVIWEKFFVDYGCFDAIRQDLSPYVGDVL
jgi:hypothetical protein